MATRVAEYPTAEPFLPKVLSLPKLRDASKGCEGCPLYKIGTQTVFGEGPRGALVMFVGEQPGDQEDRAGRPFVGPAGQLLDEMLDRAGVDRSNVYVTNAVKHFKWEPRGTRRIHSKPSSREVQACKPWLVAEVEVVKPKMIVALGATAAQALFGPQFRVTRDRGNPVESQWASWSMATIHPSALLRMPDDQAREEGKIHFLNDLKKVARQLRLEKKKLKTGD